MPRVQALLKKAKSQREDQLEILVCFFVSEDALGNLKEAPEFDQGRNAVSDRRLEHVFAHPAES
jgi:hypothetical protein